MLKIPPCVQGRLRWEKKLGGVRGSDGNEVTVQSHMEKQSTCVTEGAHCSKANKQGQTGGKGEFALFQMPAADGGEADISVQG